ELDPRLPPRVAGRHAARDEIVRPVLDVGGEFLPHVALEAPTGEECTDGTKQLPHTCSFTDVSARRWDRRGRRGRPGASRQRTQRGAAGPERAGASIGP